MQKGGRSWTEHVRTCACTASCSDFSAAPLFVLPWLSKAELFTLHKEELLILRPPPSISLTGIGTTTKIRTTGPHGSRNHLALPTAGEAGRRGNGCGLRRRGHEAWSQGGA